MRIDTPAALTVVALLLTPVCWSQDPPIDSDAVYSIAQIASGESWKTTLTLVNLSARENSVVVSFVGSDGLPLVLPVITTQGGVKQELDGSQVSRVIPSHATLLIESEGGVGTRVGWAEVRSRRALAGFGMFSRRGQNGGDSEATVRLDPVSVPETNTALSRALSFDNASGFTTGIALVNYSNYLGTIFVTLRDENGTQIGFEVIAVPPMGHTAFSVAERFAQSAGRRGIVLIRNTGGFQIQCLGLRFNPLGSFAPIPPVSVPRGGENF